MLKFLWNFWVFWISALTFPKFSWKCAPNLIQANLQSYSEPIVYGTFLLIIHFIVTSWNPYQLIPVTLPFAMATWMLYMQTSRKALRRYTRMFYWRKFILLIYLSNYSNLSNFSLHTLDRTQFNCWRFQSFKFSQHLEFKSKLDPRLFLICFDDFVKVLNMPRLSFAGDLKNIIITAFRQMIT